MTHRERFLAVLEGRRPDRLPWVPRLDIWFYHHRARGTLPGCWQGWDLRRVTADLGAGYAARDGRVYRKKLVNVEVREERGGGRLRRTWVTPVGTVSAVYGHDPHSERMGIPFSTTCIEHMIKSPADYRVVSYIEDHVRYEPCYEEYRRYDEEIGDEGLPLCKIEEVPMNIITREYIGWNRSFYELVDHPGEVLALAEVMTRRQRDMQALVLESPGRLFLNGAHFDSQMTPPPFFREHILPYYRDFCPRMKARGKWVAFHQDADASLLLDLLLETGAPVADCFACSPLVRCTLKQALDAWGDEIVIWGGIPSTLFCPLEYSDAGFSDYLDDFLPQLSRGRVIPAISDNLLPEGDIERVRLVSDRLATLSGV